MAIDLTPYAEGIDNGLAEGSFCVLATQGADGVPDIGYKGSVQVFDRDHLSYWERTRGQHLANLTAHPGVAVLYFNRERGKYLRLYGQAELFENGPVREQIMARTPEPELARDPERQGVGVLIRVDRLVEAFGGVTQQRESAAAA
jgi:predicted pyridoxine 5'-phosphate oxidase superfamily flavin-nucleotide-binding protein